MKTQEMKDILFQKLQDEQCDFRKSDISITKQKESYKIVIKGYEHIPFKMTFEHDNYFGYIVSISNTGDIIDYENIVFVENQKEYDIKTALIRLGYYIGTRF